MHDKFENEVQNKMEELNLTPSTPVWEKIELEIRPEKKRRRAIVWLFFGLLFLGGGFFTYELMKDKSAETVSVQSTPTSIENKSNQTPLENKTGIPVTAKDPTNNSSNKTETIDSPTPVTENTIEPISKKSGKTPSQIFAKQTKSTVLNEPRIIENNAEPIEKKTPITQEELTAKKETNIQQEKIGGIIQENTTVKRDSVFVDPSPKLNDSLTIPTEKKQNEIPATTDSILKKKVASKNNWRKNASISLGKSDYVTASLKAYSPIASNPVNYQSPVTSGAGVPPVYKPSQINCSFAFSAGFSLTKKIGSHFELGIGLQYAYYSTTMNVGQRRRDTVVQNSVGGYTASQSFSNSLNNNNEYTNRFHAIEFPVTISWQPALQVPLYLTVGAAYGQLLSTNVLSYNRSSNLYFQDKENYTSQMLPVSTSIQVALFARKKLSLRIGPTVQYNLLKVKKEIAGGTPHLFFAGIKSGIYF